MVDVQMIQERLDKLAEYLEVLNKHRSLSYDEFRKDLTVVLAVERALQLAIQVVIDIASHILATTSNKHPNDYSEAIIQLAEVGVLPAAYAGKIMAMAGFRNILVHEYVNVDRRIVHRNMQEHLNDFVLFGEYINQWLDKYGLLKPPESVS